MATQPQILAINAMDLRHEPGTYLDRVDYRNEKFIVKRAGRPKAILVSVREYEQMERRKREAKERFWAMTQELQAAFKDVDPGEVEQAIETAIAEIRAANRSSST